MASSKAIALPPSRRDTVGSGRYRTIEAGRGLASLAVLLFHSLANYSQASLTPVLAVFRPATNWGWLGVHVFFAISGWCIAERLTSAVTRGETSWRFLNERFLRIFPTYWAAVGVTMALRLAASLFNATSPASNLPVRWTGWLGTVLLVDPYFKAMPYLAVSWSLVYELGFYLCAALAVALWRARLSNGWTLFAAGALLCFMPWAAHTGRAPWLVLELWPDFFAGIAAWCVVRRGARAAGYGMLAALTAVSVLWPAYGGAGRLTAILTALALIILFPFDVRVAGYRITRTFVWVGNLSYPLYLIHLSLISPCKNLGSRLVSSSSPLFLGLWITSLGLAITGGWLLHRWVEAPVEYWRKHRQSLLPVRS
jgi:peptidoglycan/LPS O-acetylase OafA/YrhL